MSSSRTATARAFGSGARGVSVGDDGSYAWEKLFLAVETLASGTGPLYERLDDAYAYHLGLLRPDYHFPWPNLETEFLMIVEKFGLHNDRSSWSEDDMRKTAKRIVSLYNAVTRRLPRL